MDADPDPRTVRRVSVESPVPEPADCVPSCEPITTRVSLSDGWLAVTPRQVLVYRTDRAPPLVTIPRPNVTSVAIRRSGDGPVVRYAPRVAAYGVVGILVGLLFGALVPAASVDIPQDSPAAGAFGFVTVLTGGLQLLGDAAILFGAVALVGALGALGYRLATGGNVVVVEVAGGSPVQCRAAAGGERRALRRIEDALAEPAGTGATGTTDVGTEREPGGTDSDADTSTEREPGGTDSDADTSD